MMRMILPVVLMILGLGGGIGAGLYLVSPPTEEVTGPCGAIDAAMESGHDVAANAGGDGHGESADRLAGGREYVRLNNQFVIPVVQGSSVVALVIMSISVEVPEGQQEAVLLAEPKLRDVFLQVLFDHANTGGFGGMFTATDNMRSLRTGLLTAAQDALGNSVTDVLIVDLVRQDV